MAFRGRGGSRGGGGTQGRGGRGRGGALGRGASKVPAFPVVSAAPIRRASFDDDDGDAPPTAVSARAGREDDVDYSKMRTSAPPRRGGAGNYHQKQQHQQQPQRPQRQHEGMPSNKARVQPPKAAPAAVADGAPSAPRKVITTVTSEGTELPKRLNNKIFIDGLPYNYEAAGKPSLEDEIMQFATAWKVGKPLRLIKRPGQGFGFLVFQSPHSVATAIRVLNGRKFLGRSLRVEEPKPRDLEAVQDIAGMKDLGKDSFSRQVLLTDLAKVAQPEIIREVLREVAPQLEAKLDTIKMTSNNRKAFLTFTSDEDVQPALRFFDGFQLLGRKVSAVPAAAPGSLPYSRGGAGRATPAAPLPGASGSSTAEGVEDFDEMVVPLGAEVPQKEARAPRKLATPLQQTSSSAANVSGITSKYNLLDQGPCEVYVGNLADDITAEQLRQHFAACGKLKSCELLVHPQTRLATGIARLTFVLPAYAAYAQEKLHGSRLRGCVLRVDRGDDASAPLTEELPAPTNEDDDYDEEAYLRRYGVTDKAAYFKGTSLEEEMGAATTPGKKRSSAEAVGTKKGAKAAEPATKRAKKEKLPAVDDDEGDDDDDMGFVVSGMVGPGGKGGDDDDDDDDDDEEHFYDVDEGAVEPAKPKKGGKKGTSAKSSGGKPGKKARKA